MFVDVWIEFFGCRRNLRFSHPGGQDSASGRVSPSHSSLLDGRFGNLVANNFMSFQITVSTNAILFKIRIQMSSNKRANNMVP